MSQSWFYLAGDQLIGPISPDQLRAACSAGLVSHDTRVRQGTSDNWYLACDVAGLLSVSPQVAPAQVSPPVVIRGAPPSPIRVGAALPAAGEVVEPQAFGPRAKPPELPPAPKSISPLSMVITALCVMVACLLLGLAVRLVWRFPNPPAEQSAAATASPDASPRELAAGQSAAATASPDAPPSELAAGQSAAATASPDAPPSELAAGQSAAGDSAGQPAGQQEIEPSGAAVATQAAGGAALAKNDPPPPVLASKPVIQPGADTTTSRPERIPFESRADLTPQGRIDELVFDKLQQLGIQPASLCSDAVFVRRVYLDVIGTLPTAQEAKDFLRDGDPNKRRALIDHLLDREEFADYWAMKWGDLLRVKAEFPINLWPYAAQAYHRWIRTCIRQNMPYDQFVRELLTSSGSNFRVPQVNFYRALQSKEPQAIAQAVALTFMGARAENWPKDRLAGMAAFFSQIGYKSTGEWKEEIVLFDPGKAKVHTAGAASPTPIFPDGTPAKLSPDQDPRELFADWLIDAKNPWFARHVVNRVWYWLLGRGMVHEPDDVRPDNPPQNPELLNWLGRELIAARYDLKHIYRLILNSKTYQLSSIPRTKGPQSAANFAHYPLRRLEAEVLVDALCQITGTTEKYSSLIPEPFTFLPEDQRSIALPDGSITSSFLEMFGRPPRDTGLESERNNRTTAAQRLHLLNSSHIRRKIEQSAKFQAPARSKGKPREIPDDLYLTILSRFPTDEERNVVRAYAESGGAKGQTLVTDVAWALINSEEFLHRH